MVNQTLIATNMIGFCEALLYAQRAGLDLERVMQSVGSGAAGSWSLSNLGPRIIGNNFDPGFFVEHFVKDMGIVLQEAKRMQLALPGLALAHQLYIALQAQEAAGWGRMRSSWRWRGCRDWTGSIVRANRGPAGRLRSASSESKQECRFRPQTAGSSGAS